MHTQAWSWKGPQRENVYRRGRTWAPKVRPSQIHTASQWQNWPRNCTPPPTSRSHLSVKPIPLLDNFAHHVVPTESFKYKERPSKNDLIIAPHQYPGGPLLMKQWLHCTLSFYKYRNQPTIRWQHVIPWSIFFQPAFQRARPGFGAGGSVCVRGSGGKGKASHSCLGRSFDHIFHCPVKQLVIQKAFGGLSSDPAAMGPFFQMTKCLPHEATHCTCPKGRSLHPSPDVIPFRGPRQLKGLPGL